MIHYEYKMPGWHKWRAHSLSTHVEIPDEEKDAHRKNIAARLTRETGSPHDWRDVQFRAVQS